MWGTSVVKVYIFILIRGCETGTINPSNCPRSISFILYTQPLIPCLRASLISISSANNPQSTLQEKTQASHSSFASISKLQPPTSICFPNAAFDQDMLTQRHLRYRYQTSFSWTSPSASIFHHHQIPFMTTLVPNSFPLNATIQLPAPFPSMPPSSFQLLHPPK